MFNRLSNKKWFKVIIFILREFITACFGILKLIFKAIFKGSLSNYNAISNNSKQFYSKIAGVTFKNDNGTERQSILKKCRSGEKLKLKHIPVKQDKNAVAVFRLNGEQLGNLNRDLAEEISKELDKGKMVKAFISELTGGTGEHKTIGCNLKIIKYN